MLPLTRHSDATAINRVLNDPSVRPWVADEAEGVLDISATVANPANVLLMGEHGGCMFFRLLPGVYEVHTQVLPEGRGEWTTQLTRAAAHWMFTRTDAHELMTRVPHGHIAAKTATIAAGGRYEFTREDGCLFMGKRRAVHVYALRIQDWLSQAEHLVERGAWFHEFLHAEAKRLGVTDEAHGDDPGHNRQVGACLEMALGGQLEKSVWFYNRWALVARHRTIRLVSTAPPTVQFDIGLLRLDGDRLEIVPC